MANKVILIGNVGKNPDCRKFDSGTEMAAFSLATTERWTANGEKKEETSWHNVVFWGKLAVLCKQYVFKGSKVYIEGKIKYESYEKDGVKKYITKIIGEKIEFLSKRDESQQSHDSGDSSVDATEGVPDFDTDEDIPF